MVLVHIPLGDKSKPGTHRKLMEEVKRIYKNKVPGATTAEQKAKIEKL